MAKTIEEWIEDTEEQHDDEEVEFIKLNEGDSIEGILLDKITSTKRYNKETLYYKIKTKDNPVLQMLRGTTVLDRKMQPRQIGEPIKIERQPDQKTDQGITYQVYKTYHKPETAEANQ